MLPDDAFDQIRQLQIAFNRLKVSAVEEQENLIEMIDQNK
jgi:hypothetical protein